MFPILQSSAPAATAQLEAFFGITKRYAMGLQQLADLNLQTVKAVFEESASVLTSGSDVKPGDFMGFQWTLFAEVPEKSAAYARHFFQIVRETEADIFKEARSQYEQYGSGMKGAFESAMQQGSSQVQKSIASISDVASSAHAASAAPKLILDASESTVDSVTGATNASIELLNTSPKHSA
ncbi:TIGR01841 family phasin [Caballeronia sp. LP006]|uniref:TIGR01841 family phasin n=1 Tax=Caballeronia sp. LP006 TaxID=3038552 RepID=UPI002861B1C1|nr:TIGR01841 family phasin [Caballeronia sp. LP006]MDR5827972.1 TIGR01841 family phasin [Caballeronia sp. LP006]